MSEKGKLEHFLNTIDFCGFIEIYRQNDPKNYTKLVIGVIMLEHVEIKRALSLFLSVTFFKYHCNLAYQKMVSS